MSSTDTRSTRQSAGDGRKSGRPFWHTPDAGRLLAAISIYALFVGCEAIAFWVFTREPRPEWAQHSMVWGNEIAAIAFAFFLRSRSLPAFSVGSLTTAARRVWYVWVLCLALGLWIGIPSDLVRVRTAHHPTVVISALLASITLVPFAEECLFRGVLQTLLADTRWGRPARFGVSVATLITSVLFGLAHLVNLVAGASVHDALFATVSAAMIGLVLGAIYQRTGNLWYGVLLHAVGNLALGV